jgi:hypothetical protein
MAQECNINNRECHVFGYNVIAEEGEVAGTVQFSMAQNCPSLHDNCRVKAILVKVYRDWLAAQGVLQNPMADCVYAEKCSKGGPGMAFYQDSHTLVVDPAVNVPGATVTVPASPVSVFVALPISCENVFV